MVKSKLNIVWLKRDLRTQDHLPLFEAEATKQDYIIIYIFEPSLLEYPDSSMRHQQFIYHSILEMNDTLNKYGRNVNIFHAEATDVFLYLFKTFDIQTVYSYQEIGIKATWKRDNTIRDLSAQKAVRIGNNFSDTVL